MKKNAFTLVELIATIGLLGMLATITITVLVRKINEAKEKARDTMIESIELAAKNYINDYGNEIQEFNNNDNIYITLQTLVEKEYFTESLIDPTTKKSLPLTNEIYVTREESGEIISTYNVNQRSVPKLTLIGSYNEYVEEGSDYVEKGVNALSPSKEDVSTNVTITGTVDTTTPDTYKITYEVDNEKIIRNVIVYSKNLSSDAFYKFTVNLDGGTDNIEYEKKYKTGSTITLEEPTKEGYKFIGWNLKGKGANINGNIVTIGPGTITITALWEQEIIPISFKDDDWSIIVAAVKSGNYPYKVGDTKEIDLGDELGKNIIRVSNISSCKSMVYSHTACGFVLEFVNIITTNKMNDTNTNAGGWTSSLMRTFINETIYNALPEELKNAVINTNVVSTSGNSYTSCVDKLYLLSPQEVYGISFTNENNLFNKSRQLDWYEENNITIENYTGAIKNNGNDTGWWWLRSTSTEDSSNFYVIYTTGNFIRRSATNVYGIAPAFKIG